MDPVAHTLVGAALAETGLKRLSRYATPTLIVGANLPDVDVIAYIWGSDAALYFRRGWSHGALAIVLLPLLLAGGVWLWHRWRGQHNTNETAAPPFRMGVIVALSFVAVWSHTLLDWMNTYGIRLLMPFSDRWFYGDTLFIVDPWVWLLTAAGVVLARSTTYSAIAGWLTLTALTTGLIMATGLVPTAVKLLWLAGIAAIAALRWLKPTPGAGRIVAKTGMAALTLYVCVAYGLARVAESTIAKQFPKPLEAQANPLPGTPSRHRVVLVYDTFYRVVNADGKVVEVPRQEPNSIVKAALKSASIQGFVTWARYPYWEVEETENSWIVRFRDLRYQTPGTPSPGIGFAQVEVPKHSLESSPAQSHQNR